MRVDLHCCRMLQGQRCRLVSVTPARVCVSCLCVVFLLNLLLYSWPCPWRHTSELRSMKHGLIKVLPDHHRRTGTEEDSLLKDVPPTVHFLWCGSSSFQFQHYLSVLSAYKLLQPTEIIFLYRTLPQPDKAAYYQYYDDLLRDVPNLFPVPLNDNTACDGSSANTFRYLTKLLRQGGVFLGINVVLSDKILPYMKNRMSTYNPSSKFYANGVILTSPLSAASSSVNSRSSIPCAVNPSTYSRRHPCVSVQSELFPTDIFHMDTDFGQLARLVGYGTRDTLTLNPGNSLIPNVVHYVWMGHRTLSFFGYLSLLSSVFVQEVEAVYVHCDHEPAGPHWHHAKQLPRLKVVRRQFPRSVYGLEVTDPSDVVDLLRLDLLRRYGGIIVDWEDMWVRPLSEAQRRYDAVAWMDQPDGSSLRLGVMAAKKGATFLNFLMESFRRVDTNQVFSPKHTAYKVYELHPESVHVDQHIQVACIQEECRPTWPTQGNHGNVSANSADTFNWKTDTNIVHWTYRTPIDFTDKVMLMSGTGMVADMGRYVLGKAKQLSV